MAFRFVLQNCCFPRKSNQFLTGAYTSLPSFYYVRYHAHEHTFVFGFVLRGKILCLNSLELATNHSSTFPLWEEARKDLWERLADAFLHSNEITPETAYAMKKTGLLVTKQNEGLLTAAQRNAWRDALYEYRASRAERSVRLELATLKLAAFVL